MKKHRPPPPLPPPDYSFALVVDGSADAERVSLWFLNHTDAAVGVRTRGRATLDLSSGPLALGSWSEARREVAAKAGLLLDADRGWASDVCLSFELELVSAAGTHSGHAQVWMDPPGGTAARMIPELGRQGWTFRVDRGPAF